MCGALQKRTFIQHDIAKLTHGMPNIYQRKRKGERDISLAIDNNNKDDSPTQTLQLGEDPSCIYRFLKEK